MFINGDAQWYPTSFYPYPPLAGIGKKKQDIDILMGRLLGNSPLVVSRGNYDPSFDLERLSEVGKA